MKRYVCTLRPKGRASGQSPVQHVLYDAEDYTEAWIGARSVCRLGTKEEKRVFLDPQTGGPITLEPGVWVVKEIFVEGTRKTGKRRMTALSTSQVFQVIDRHNIPISTRLRNLLAEMLDDTEGLRVTTARARELGIDPDNGPS